MAINFLNSIESITLPGTTTDYYIGGSGGGVALLIWSTGVSHFIDVELPVTDKILVPQVFEVAQVRGRILLIERQLVPVEVFSGGLFSAPLPTFNRPPQGDVVCFQTPLFERRPEQSHVVVHPAILNSFDYCVSVQKRS